MATGTQTFLRTRDCCVWFKGDAYTVAVAPDLLAKGWAGGQFVQWADSARDEFTVKASDGLYGGFLLWGSDEVADQLTGMVGAQTIHGYATLCAGGWMLSTNTFEKYTWQSRQGNGPLVPITYTVGQRLVLSLRGWMTNQDEWTLSGDPRAPNDFVIAQVIQAPSDMTSGMLTVQTSI